MSHVESNVSNISYILWNFKGYKAEIILDLNNYAL